MTPLVWTHQSVMGLPVMLSLIFIFLFFPQPYLLLLHQSMASTAAQSRAGGELERRGGLRRPQAHSAGRVGGLCQRTSSGREVRRAPWSPTRWREREERGGGDRRDGWETEETQREKR
jgi:hypothetical protein